MPWSFGEFVCFLRFRGSACQRLSLAWSCSWGGSTRPQTQTGDSFGISLFCAKKFEQCSSTTIGYIAVLPCSRSQWSSSKPLMDRMDRGRSPKGLWLSSARGRNEPTIVKTFMENLRYFCCTMIIFDKAIYEYLLTLLDRIPVWAAFALSQLWRYWMACMKEGFGRRLSLVGAKMLGLVFCTVLL